MTGVNVMDEQAAPETVKRIRSKRAVARKRQRFADVFRGLLPGLSVD